MTLVFILADSESQAETWEFLRGRHLFYISNVAELRAFQTCRCLFFLSFTVTKHLSTAFEPVFLQYERNNKNIQCSSSKPTKAHQIVRGYQSLPKACWWGATAGQESDGGKQVLLLLLLCSVSELRNAGRDTARSHLSKGVNYSRASLCISLNTLSYQYKHDTI